MRTERYDTAAAIDAARQADLSYRRMLAAGVRGGEYATVPEGWLENGRRYEGSGRRFVDHRTFHPSQSSPDTPPSRLAQEAWQQ